MSERWYEWVESFIVCIRRMSSSLDALHRVSQRLREALDIRGRVYKTKGSRDKATSLFYA